MFNRKLKKRVKELEKKMWGIENPPYYDILDEIDLGCKTLTITDNNIEWQEIYKGHGYFKRLFSVVIRRDDGTIKVRDMSDIELSMHVSEYEKNLKISKDAQKE